MTVLEVAGADRDSREEVRAGLALSSAVGTEAGDGAGAGAGDGRSLDKEQRDG